MSLNVDPSEWRLSTDGGIPYKLMEGYPKGSGSQESAEITERIIIKSTDIETFFNESFPATIPGPPGTSFTVNRPRKCPHRNRFYTENITFEPQESTKPMDPYSIDTGAPESTYVAFATLEIVYKPLVGQPIEDPDSVDGEGPEYELTGNATGEFLMLPAMKLVWVPLEGEIDNFQQVNFKVPFVLPTIHWTARWSNLSRTSASAMLTVARSLMGTVNSVVMPQIYNAPAETILFLGFNIGAGYTLVWGEVTRTFLELELNFHEKNMDNGGDVRIHHNIFYNPDKGKWERLERLDDQPIYVKKDLRSLFVNALV